MVLNQPVGVPRQNPTDYTGPDMCLIPIKRFPREPLLSDKRYRIGQFAILGRSPSTGQEGELWYLANFFPNGDANWVQFGTGMTNLGIQFIETDDGPPPVAQDGSAEVQLFGSPGIITSGQGPGSTITLTLDGSVVGQTITGDNPVPLSPLLGNWNIVGGTAVTTFGAGNTLTINFDGSLFAIQFDTQSGTATPAGGILEIFGGNGTTSFGAANRVTVEMQTDFVGDFTFRSDTAGVTEFLTSKHTSDTANSNAAMAIEVAGDNAGDPYQKFSVGATNSFAWGIDNDDNDKFHLNHDASGSVTPSTGTNLINISTSQIFFELNSNITRFSNDTSQTEIGLRNTSVLNGVDSAARLFVFTASQEADAYLFMSTGARVIPGDRTWKIGVNGGNDGDFEWRIPTNAAIPSLAGALRFVITRVGQVNCESTRSITIPRGTTAQRPPAPVNGMLRYNNTTNKFEGYENGVWTNLI